RLQKERNNVGFWIVSFPVSFNRSARIKVAKRGYAPAICRTIPLKYALKGQLALPIGIDGILRIVFLNRNACRISIHRCRRRENKVPNTSLTQALQEHNSRSQIV